MQNARGGEGDRTNVVSSIGRSGEKSFSPFLYMGFPQWQVVGGLLSTFRTNPGLSLPPAYPQEYSLRRPCSRAYRHLCRYVSEGNASHP